VAGIVNERQAEALKRLIEAGHPDAATTVKAEPDGAEVTISGPRKSPGVSGSGTAMDVELRLSDDGPLMRFLLNGHL
jgi:hypothetical protein